MIVTVDDTNLKAIADAIRTKNGGTATYKVSEMAAAILDNKIYFTVGETEYQCESGMTWNDFMNSDYDTEDEFSNWYYSDRGYYSMNCSKGDVVYDVCLNDVPVYWESTIVAGTVYEARLSE